MRIPSTAQRRNSDAQYFKHVLWEVDGRLGLPEAVAGTLPDPRSPLPVKHQTEQLLRQRVSGLCQSHEDLDDRDSPRCDPVLQTESILVEQFIAPFKEMPTGPVPVRQRVSPSGHLPPRGETHHVRIVPDECDPATMMLRLVGEVRPKSGKPQKILEVRHHSLPFASVRDKFMANALAVGVHEISGLAPNP